MWCIIEYHQQKMPYKRITEIIANYGGKSHNCDSCGLHIHINKSYLQPELELNTLKLIYLYEKFWGQLVTISRRTESQLSAYAKRYNDNEIFTDNTIDNPHSKVRDLSRGRYYAVNITNSNTVEFRIFRGTLKLVSLLACIELTHYMVNYVKYNDVYTVTRNSWTDFTSGIDVTAYPNLIEYLKSKELYNAIYIISEVK